MWKKWVYLFAALIVLQALSAALYLGKAGQFGFPLDDSWIHQTYARNLGLRGAMEFSPRHPSTGSTSFGWTALLASGYLLRVPFFFWTYLWGSIFAIATAFIAARLSQFYFGDFRKAALVAVICILEWHLAWASVSGMEIGLFTFLTLAFFLLLKRNISPWLLGALTGITVLVRPEGILLVFIYVLRLLSAHPYNLKRILGPAAAFVLAFAVIISPWIVFNLTYSHKPFPNTISAKFIRYAYPLSLWKSLRYLWDVIVYFLNGPLLLLVAGTVFLIYRATRTKTIIDFYPLTWFSVLIVQYAVALPILPDQGRYIMPLIPLVIIYGMEGLDQLVQKYVRTSALRLTVWFSLAGMVVVLWINGASDYAFRVQILNTVHAEAAYWLNANTPPDAVIATHDIGIIGYNTERQIVDLLGLVTPEILPILDDPQKMADYVRAKQTTHLVLYSGYYRELLNLLQARLVFSPGGEQMRAIGAEPFEVYEIGR